MLKNRRRGRRNCIYKRNGATCSDGTSTSYISETESSNYSSMSEYENKAAFKFPGLFNKTCKVQLFKVDVENMRTGKHSYAQKWSDLLDGEISNSIVLPQTEAEVTNGRTSDALLTNEAQLCIKGKLLNDYEDASVVVEQHQIEVDRHFIRVQNIGDCLSNVTEEQAIEMSTTSYDKTKTKRDCHVIIQQENSEEGRCSGGQSSSTNMEKSITFDHVKTNVDCDRINVQQNAEGDGNILCVLENNDDQTRTIGEKQAMEIPITISCDHFKINLDCDVINEQQDGEDGSNLFRAQNNGQQEVSGVEHQAMDLPSSSFKHAETNIVHYDIFNEQQCTEDGENFYGAWNNGDESSIAELLEREYLNTSSDTNENNLNGSAFDEQEEAEDNVNALMSSNRKKDINKCYCIFCGTLKTNIGRHFTLAHGDEKGVIKLLSFKKGSIERNKIIWDLKKKGNFKFGVSNNSSDFFIEQNHNKNTLDNYDCDDQCEPSVAQNLKKTERKKEFCKFCKQLKTNIARHFEIMHGDQEEVLQFLKHPKKSEERVKILTRLRKQGNFIYNLNNKHNLILTRRRHVYKEPYNPTDYFLPCPVCKAFYSRKYIKTHHEGCAKVKNENANVRSVIRDSRTLTTEIHPAANEILKKKIIPPMRRDKIFQVFIKDKLIILFGNHFTSKYIGHQEYMIRQRLRFLGRYFISVQKLGCRQEVTLKKLSDLFVPRYFELAMNGVSDLARLNNLTGVYISPKLALEMVQYLKICCNILESNCIREGKKKKQKRVKNFLKLLTTEATGRINKPAHRDLVAQSRQNRIEKIKRIPLSEDIKIFQKFLIDQALTVYGALTSNGFDFDNFKKLMELTLLYITVFNRKRSGEAHRILVQDFKNMHALTSTTLRETVETLSLLDKQKAETTYKIVIRGKLDRTVHAYVTSQVKDFLDYIYLHRTEANVPEDNPYLFGLPGKLSGMRFKTLETCMLMRKYTIKAGLQNPENVRTTLLRYHFATSVSTLELKEAQQETVMDFMGHHERIHKGFYRQQVISKDLMINKILDQDTNSNSKKGYSFSENHKQKLEDANTHNKKTQPTTEEFNDTQESDNEEIYKSNLHVLQTTPKKCRLSTRYKRSKQISKHTIDEDDEPEPYSENTDDDPTVHPPTSDSESSSQEEIPINDNRSLVKGRNAWTSAERNTALSAFQKHIKNMKVPTLTEVKGVFENFPTLKHRTPAQVKAWLTHYVKRKKDPTQMRQRWSTPEKKRLHQLFGHHIVNGTYPSQMECHFAIENYKELKGRTVAGLKSYLQHTSRKETASSSF